MDSTEILLAHFAALYRSLNHDSLTTLAKVYHQDIHFVDPVGEHHGPDALTSYFNQLLTSLKYCDFMITEVHHTPEHASLFWQMHYAHPRLRRGRALELSGMSQLRFAEGRIIYQRDYYDLGAMLYEHLPLLGKVIVSMKRRLQIS